MAFNLQAKLNPFSVALFVSPWQHSLWHVLSMPDKQVGEKVFWYRSSCRPASSAETKLLKFPMKFFSENVSHSTVSMTARLSEQFYILIKFSFTAAVTIQLVKKVTLSALEPHAGNLIDWLFSKSSNISFRVPSNKLDLVRVFQLVSGKLMSPQIMTGLLSGFFWQDLWISHTIICRAAIKSASRRLLSPCRLLICLLRIEDNSREELLK